jgi:hypothetical protein
MDARNIQAGREDGKSEEKSPKIDSVREAQLLALFRLLTKEPPPDHDFKTCPICKRYGITKI